MLGNVHRQSLVRIDFLRPSRGCSPPRPSSPPPLSASVEETVWGSFSDHPQGHCVSHLPHNPRKASVYFYSQADSFHEVSRSNHDFPARIGLLLVLVHLMALRPPHTKHKSKLVYCGVMNNVGMMFEGFHNLYGTQPPAKTASTSGSLRVIGDH